MALGKRHSINTFVTKFLWILFLVFQESNLVICDGFDDDSLKKALQAIERRQRDLELQENDYYGQPENIGYGFQKTLGFFDNTGPATELGSFDSEPKNENELQNILLNYGGYRKDGDYEGGFDKRKSNFRERMAGDGKNYLVNERDNGEDYSQSSLEYLQMLRNLWSKYRQSRSDDFNIEDLTDEQVEEILNSLNEKDGPEEGFGGDLRSPEPNNYDSFVVVRRRRNRGAYDWLNDRNPGFREGVYGKRNSLLQNLNGDGLSENGFLYALKYVNSEANREAVENLRDEGFEVFGDEKDKDIMRILNNAMNRPKYAEEEEPYWMEDQNNYDEGEAWLQGPVTFAGDAYEEVGRNEKKEFSPRYFKNHDGIHLNTKRFPVKRSSIRVRKEVKNEKVSKELKGIFSTQEATTVPPKKTSEKKPTEILKKQNATKPEVTKHHEGKKVVRRSDKYTKEQIFPMNKDEELANIFSVDKKSVKKKSIDWSQYFGLDKRSGQGWLQKDYIQRAEGHLMAPKKKRYSFDRGNVGNVNFLDGSQYEMPFDTRKFNMKRYSYDLGSNIDKVENKIGDIEEKIIDDAVKYTGAHSGAGNEDLSKVKSKVIQHLEAAYSLEKMKNALEEFKNLIKPEKSSEVQRKPSTEAPKTETRTAVPKESSNLEKPLSEKKPAGEANKRVATKKEGVKNIFAPESSDSLEFLNEGYANKQYENEACPVLDKILHNCLRVEEMGGRYAELLVPLCTLQQICYFCGPEIGFSKMSMCDATYLTEAENICQGESGCLISARNSMLALQDLYEQELMNEKGRRLLSGSCLANPCIQRYFLNSPGAIYPLEVQN